MSANINDILEIESGEEIKVRVVFNALHKEVIIFDHNGYGIEMSCDFFATIVEELRKRPNLSEFLIKKETYEQS